MKSIFPNSWGCVAGSGAALTCLIMATSAAGFQVGHFGETTDPYFRKPSQPAFPRVAEPGQLVDATGNSWKPDWSESGNYKTNSVPSMLLDNAPHNSIIQTTQDWNEKQIARDETQGGGSFDAVSATNLQLPNLAQTENPKLTQLDRSSVEDSVVPPWRRKDQPDGQFDFNSDSPAAIENKPLDQPTASGNDFALPGLPSRQSEFQPANKQPTAPSIESDADSPDTRDEKHDTFEGGSLLPLGSGSTTPANKPPTPSTSGLAKTGDDSDFAGIRHQTSPEPSLSDTTTTFEPGRVLALVGGEPVFLGDLLFDVNNFIKKVAPDAPEAVIDQQRPILIKKMLPRFIDAKLLYIGTVRGLPEQVDLEKILEQAGKEFDDKALKQMMEQTGTQTTAEFDAHLRSLGSSLRKMRHTWAKEQLVRFFLSKQLNVDTDVTHQEMLDYYHEHQAEYLIPARAKWEQIMVRFDKFSSRDEARKAIVELGDKVVYGAKLDAVAKENSQGFLASEGGQHDWTTQDALVLKELDKAIFELPIGKLSEIIETRDGYHIVRVIEREGKSKKSFLDAQVEIRQKLEEQKRESAFQEHLKKLKQEIPVEVFDVSEDHERMGDAPLLGN